MGRFVVFEGGEGSGKSTQARLLADRWGAVFSFEPGGTPVGQQLRQILLSPETGDLEPRAEALLMAADRAHHVATLIRPALLRGRDVVCDRYVGSSLAYQGHARGIGVEAVRAINDFGTDGLVPDLVVLLVVPPEVAGERLAAAGAPDRLEAAGDEFHQKVAEAYGMLAAHESDRWVVVDGTGPIDAVAERVLSTVEARLPTGAGAWSAFPGMEVVDDAWTDVVGQPAAVELLQAAAGGQPPHAWLFVGPHGSGKRAAARAFAGELLAVGPAAAGDGEGAERAKALARIEQHPDLIVVERVGAAISRDQAVEIVTRASRSAVEGDRKVLVLDEFHLMQADVAPRLLKTIEEPPAGTFFVVLADELTPDLVTIASRCVRVDFAPLTAEVIAERLLAEGIDPARAAEASSFASGDLTRARLLATDDRLALRLAAWRDLPRRLNGTGFAAGEAMAELRAAIDDALVPLQAKHDEEAAEMDERIERYGQRGSGAKQLEERHKREVRRLRTDDLRMGLAVLAAAYRDEMVVAADPTSAIAAIDAIHALAEELIRNPNEELQLLALALRLPTLA